MAPCVSRFAPPRSLLHSATVADSTLICLTPIKNEAWILERFLRCASTWADHIVVADQQSDDGSREIARGFDKVTLIDNDTPSYDEQARQKLLIEAGRQIPVDGKRVLIALDADEMLSANWQQSREWQRLLEAPPGTVLRFRWINLAPDLERYWQPSDDIPFGFVDDGSPHVGRPIHSPRVPVPDGAPSLRMREIGVLHYQYTNWERMKSKQRWYQCWERLNHPEKRPVTLYRQYHHMDVARVQAQPLKEEWLAGYEQAGIDMKSIPQKSHYYWDEEVASLLQEEDADTFRKLDVWEPDWTALARRMGHQVNGELRDPRSRFEKAVHAWLGRTQARSESLLVRAVQKLLQPLGW